MERLRANPDESTFDEFEDSRHRPRLQGFTAPVLDDRGGFLGRVWTLREVTQQRELDRLKDDFVATVSYELRTPLTSMMGFLEMIREGEAGELTDEQKRFLAIVYRSSERLQRLVGDLLFVARLDASGLQLQFAEVALDELVRDVGRVSSALARSRESRLRLELAPVPIVRGDQERLVQLVGNLVSNALKFTPRAGRDRADVRRPAAALSSRSRTPASGSHGRAEPALPALLPLVDRDRAGDPGHRARARDLAGDRRGDGAARSASRPARAGERRSASSCRSSPKRLPPDADRRARCRLVVGPVPSPTTSTATPAGRRAPRLRELDAEHLVAACRAVLAQVGEGRRARDLVLLAFARRGRRGTTGR